MSLFHYVIHCKKKKIIITSEEVDSCVLVKIVSMKCRCHKTYFTTVTMRKWWKSDKKKMEKFWQGKNTPFRYRELQSHNNMYSYLIWMKNYQMFLDESKGEWLYSTEWWKRLWSLMGRDLYRATPAVTRGLAVCGLIQRTAPIQSHCTRNKGHRGPFFNPVSHGIKKKEMKD